MRYLLAALFVVIAAAMLLVLLLSLPFRILLGKTLESTQLKGERGSSEPTSCPQARDVESDEIRGLLTLWRARCHLAHVDMTQGERDAWKLMYERAQVIVASVWFEQNAPTLKRQALSN